MRKRRNKKPRTANEGITLSNSEGEKYCYITWGDYIRWILFGPDKRIGILNRKNVSVHERKFRILTG